MRNRVVVTGVGCVTPLGTTVDSLWANLKEGKSGVGPTSLFDASNFPTSIAAEVRGWSVADVGLDAQEWESRGRHTRFAVAAAKQAVEDAGVDTSADPLRRGVYLGAGEGRQDFDAFSKMMVASLAGGEFDLTGFTKAGLELLDPNAELEQEPNMPAAYVAA
ncbi:MAG: beta-ketoacyl synthase N-terminal-like domain-containing protein, partial [Planctomycetota bacterium]